jgi:hypothetical protein
MYSKNLTGSLHDGGIACTLSVGRKVQMEIPVYPAYGGAMDARQARTF